MCECKVKLLSTDLLVMIHPGVTGPLVQGENTKAEDRRDGGQHTPSKGSLWVQIGGRLEKI